MMDVRMLGKLDWNLAQAAIGHYYHQFAINHRAAFDEVSNNLFGDAFLLGHSLYLFLESEVQVLQAA